MNLNHRIRRLIGIAVLTAGWSSLAIARDPLDALEGHLWAPNSAWLALTKPNADELLFISTQTKVFFLLKPIGNFDLQTINIFASEHNTNDAPRKISVSGHVVPSYGNSRLTLAEWAPDSKKAIYQIDSQQKALFFVEEALVARRMPATEPAPWRKPDDVQTSLELVNFQSYRLHMDKRDGTTAKEVLFTEPREVAQLGLAQLNNATLASANGQFLLYPRYTERGWELIADPVAAGPSRALSLRGAPPKDWELSGNDESLAVVTTNLLLIGTLAAWEQAQSIPLPAIQCDIKWSADGRWLAYWTDGTLYLLPRGSQQPVLITQECRPRFWGWRGSRLLFFKNQAKWGDVFAVEADQPETIHQLARAPHWPPYTPLKISVAPDGQQIIAVVLQFDYAGRPTHQLWHTRLGPESDWKPIYDFGR